tara:strand:- start:275 stop:1186 length:912 start_codon:yes stop_codon:yes gene_type:complete
MSWREYLASLQEVEQFQVKMKRKNARNKKMYTMGPQDAGVAYPHKVKADSRPKSAPPGFGGALEEDVEASSFETKDELQPDIWRNDKLNSDVARHLKQIAQDFIETLEKKVSLDDVRFTGSLANYNWSEYSDIDLHIVVDFSQIDDKEELVKSYFDAERMKWNDAHDIKLFGFEVEIYVENKGEPHVSSGLYSIMRARWIVEPVPHTEDIDFYIARKKADSIATQTNLAGTLLRSQEYRKAYKATERLKKKIRELRALGLKSKEREYSMENIAFKILRRNGTLTLLNQIKDAAYDKMMSIDGA